MLEVTITVVLQAARVLREHIRDSPEVQGAFPWLEGHISRTHAVLQQIADAQGRLRDPAALEACIKDLSPALEELDQVVARQRQNGRIVACIFGPAAKKRIKELTSRLSDILVAVGAANSFANIGLATETVQEVESIGTALHNDSERLEEILTDLRDDMNAQFERLPGMMDAAMRDMLEQIVRGGAFLGGRTEDDHAALEELRADLQRLEAERDAEAARAQDLESRHVAEREEHLERIRQLTEVLEEVLNVREEQSAVAQPTATLTAAAPSMPAEFECGICQEVMEDPVVLLDSGQTYCRACIEERVASNQTPTDPFTRVRLQMPLRYVENWALKGAIASGAPAAEVAAGSGASGVPSPALREYPPDRVVLKERIARGGSGEVFRGELKRGGRQEGTEAVAVKRISVYDVGAADRTRVLGEIEMALKVAAQCDNVCRLIGYVEDGSDWLLIMELYDNSLMGLIRERSPAPLDLDEILRVAHDISRALMQMHRRHMYHNDIKPSNVLIDASGRAALCDFGLARTITTFGGQTSTHHGGTFQYCAPESCTEHFSGKSEAADVWSFGCTLLHAATGKTPYSGLNHIQVVARLGQGRGPEVPADVAPQELRDLICKCLKVEPTGRPTMREIHEVVTGMIAAQRTRNVQEREARLRRLCTVEGLRAALNDGNDTVIDLHGRSVQGSGEDTVEVTRPGVTLRNGNLRGLRLLIKSSATGTRLERISVSGYEYDGDDASSLPRLLRTALRLGRGLLAVGRDRFRVLKLLLSSLNALKTDEAAEDAREQLAERRMTAAVQIEAARGVVIKSCKLNGNTNHGLSVVDGAQVTVEGGECCGNGVYGVCAAGRGTEATVRDTKCTDNTNDGVAAQGGAKVTVEGGECCGNGLCGVAAGDSGTEATVRGAKCTDNKEVGVWASQGAKVTVEGGECCGNGLSGVTVVDSGTEATVRDTKCTDNTIYGVWAAEGAKVTVEGGECCGNGQSGVVAGGSGTEATVRDTKCTGNKDFGVVAVGGAKVTVEGGECCGNGRCGVAVSDSVTEATVRDTKCTDNTIYGVSAQEGAKVTVEGGECCGNELCGVAAIGSGTEATVRGAKCIDNKEYHGVAAQEGAKVTVEGGECCGNGGCGVGVYDSGTEATVRDTKCTDNKAFGVLAARGAKVTVEGGECCGNGQCGVHAVGSGTEVTVRGTKCTDNTKHGVWATEGAKVVGRNLQMSGNKGGNIGTCDETGGVVDVQ